LDIQNFNSERAIINLNLFTNNVINAKPNVVVKVEPSLWGPFNTDHLIETL